MTARVVLATVGAVGLAGCGVTPATQPCTGTPFLTPTSAVLDHTASGSGDMQQFVAGESYPAGCAVPAVVPLYQWSVSDPVNAAISTSGVASCKAASASPITVSTGFNGYPTAVLTCK